MKFAHSDCRSSEPPTPLSPPPPPPPPPPTPATAAQETTPADAAAAAVPSGDSQNDDDDDDDDDDDSDKSTKPWLPKAVFDLDDRDLLARRLRRETVGVATPADPSSAAAVVVAVVAKDGAVSPLSVAVPADGPPPTKVSPQNSVKPGKTL